MRSHTTNSNIDVADIKTVAIPGGTALIGTNRPVYPGDGEGPLREKSIAAFRMSATAITNAQFAQFVSASGYITEAERFGWSFVFSGALEHHQGIDHRVEGQPWWYKVNNASWQSPVGQGTCSELHDRLPVVHISYNDAIAFAMWNGAWLPTELEWEHAARGGLGDVRFPWGDIPPRLDNLRCRFGLAHSDQTAENIGPAAVDVYNANNYGLYNMVGNVWEWTSSSAEARLEKTGSDVPQKILKGGSYLCHPESCFRYRIAARISNTINSTSGHTGFRIVFPQP